MKTTRDAVLTMWCRLTGEALSDPGLRDDFLRRPQVDELATSSYPDLLDAAISAARPRPSPPDQQVSYQREGGARNCLDQLGMPSSKLKRASIATPRTSINC